MKIASKIIGRNILSDLVLLGALFTAAVSLTPSFQGIILNSDEGINLIKASLVNDGYKLYSEIWSDQGPVYTWILSLVLKAGFDPLSSGRALTAVFACILIGSIYFASLKLQGRLAALFSACFVLLLTRFLMLANSVMIGIPSISLCALGIAIILYAKSKHVYIIAGAVFCLGVELKLLSALIAPAYLAALPKKDWKSAFLFSGVGALVVIVSTLLLLADVDFNQLIGTHTTAKAKSQAPGLTYLVDLASLDLDYLALAFFGFCLSLYLGKEDFLVPFVWLLITVAALSFHSPVWKHHYMYYGIPLAWCAGLAAGRIRDLSFSQRTIGLLSICLALNLAYSLVRVPQKYTRIKEALPQVGRSMNQEVVAELKKASGTVVTDLPLYAVLAGRSVPPKIAVASVKRKRAGQISDQDFIDAVNQHNPTHVLLGRYKTTRVSLPPILLEKGYIQLPTKGRSLLFVLR